jgi:AcrR family transcriptional regulator
MPIDARRQQLLDAGIKVFADRAYEDVSIDEIAENCGVSRSLLYHYFSGKREYYIATIAHAAELLADVDPDPLLPPAQQLRVGLERYFAAVGQNRIAYAAVRRAAEADKEIAAILAAQRRDFADRVLAGMPIETHAAESELAELTARVWIRSVEEAALAWTEHPSLDAGAVVAVLSDSLVAAMAAAARLDDSISPLPEMLRG